jgi:hypothetical protein
MMPQKQGAEQFDSCNRASIRALASAGAIVGNGVKVTVGVNFGDDVKVNVVVSEGVACLVGWTVSVAGALVAAESDSQAVRSMSEKRRSCISLCMWTPARQIRFCFRELL